MTVSQAGTGRELQLQMIIGAVPLHITGLEPGLATAARARYGAFLDNSITDAAGSPSLPIRIQKEPLGGERSGEFFFGFEGATLEIRGGAIVFAGVRHEYALDTLVRVLLSQELLKRDGFLLHAASMVRNERARIFTGRSGAGKSTTAALSPEGSVLTDEISLLRRVAGKWRAFSTPFWGEFRAAGWNGSAPATCIYALEQAREHRVTPIRAVELLRRVMPNVLFFSQSAGDHRRLLEIVGGACEEIAGARLEFRKDPGFWEAIAA